MRDAFYLEWMVGLTLKISDYFEYFLFLSFSLLIYCLFVITIPIFRDPHGLLVMNELSTLSRSGFVKELIFGSAVVCVLLGAIMMSWAPVLTAGVMANLWATTYFFVWIGTVFALSTESQSLEFLVALSAGLVFIYLFFFVIHYLGFDPYAEFLTVNTKTKIFLYCIFGWMSFYFGLSCLLVFDSFYYGDFRWPLAAGTMCVCFLNYVLSLFVQRSAGKSTDRFSKIGRMAFIIWSVVLTISWAVQKIS